MIDVNSDDILKEFKTLKNELKKYNKDLLDRPSILFLTKFDILNEDNKQYKLPKNINVLEISSASNINIKQAIKMMYEKLVL